MLTLLKRTNSAVVIGSSRMDQAMLASALRHSTYTFKTLQLNSHYITFPYHEYDICFLCGRISLCAFFVIAWATVARLCVQNIKY